jgi:hypothetical protein
LDLVDYVHAGSFDSVTLVDYFVYAAFQNAHAVGDWENQRKLQNVDDV